MADRIDYIELEERLQESPGELPRGNWQLPSKIEFICRFAKLTPSAITDYKAGKRPGTKIIDFVRPINNISNFYDRLKDFGRQHKNLKPELLYWKLIHYLDPFPLHDFPPNKKILIRIEKLSKDLHWFLDKVFENSGFGSSVTGYESVPNKKALLKVAAEIVDWEKNQLVNKTQRNKRGKEKDSISIRSILRAICYLKNTVELEADNAFVTLAELTCAWNGKSSIQREVSRLRKYVRAEITSLLNNKTSFTNPKSRKLLNR